MNAAISLESMGLSLRLLENGKLAVEGLKGLNHEKREYALSLAREHKSTILEELRRRADAPTPAQLAHARRMLVDCPLTGGKVHCWRCSRCDGARACSAWKVRRQDVEFFQRSGEPYSLYLVESGAVEVVQ